VKLDKISVVTLGPQGTFSHQASKKVMQYLHLYSDNIELSFEKTIAKIFREVNNGIDIAVVPLENSEAGSIGTTMDNIIESSKIGMLIVAETDLNINHFLASKGKLSDIEIIYTHPQSYSQCELFIESNLKQAEILFTPSNSISAQKVASSEQTNIAAIVPLLCTEIYHLPILAKKIQNSNINSTRFMVITAKDHIKKLFESRIKSKSTILIDPRDDRPGLLSEILQIFAAKLINLTKIESRPSKRRLGDYVFYVDLQADLSHPILQSCVEELQQIVSLRNLGSYNRIN
jgi:prephenate dehydratase